MKKRLILVITLLIVIVASTSVILIVMNKKEGKGVEGEDRDSIEYSYEISILTVVDFKDNKETDRGEAKYSVKEKKTKVYRNGEYVYDSKIVANENIGVIDFEPEKYLNTIIDNKINIDNYMTNIENVYNIDISTSEAYIAMLIKDGDYKLIRRVNAPTYCEAYLVDSSDNILRIIATSDRLVKATLKRSVEIKEIDKYFEKMEVEVDNED